MKIKSGAKYKILCDYRNRADKEELKAGTIVEVDCISPWFRGQSDICYTLVCFKNSFSIYAHEFMLIAEEINKEEIKNDTDF